MNPELLEAIQMNDIENVKSSLTALSANVPQDQKVDLSSTDFLESLLKFENNDVLRLTCLYVAEIGRKEDNRKDLTKPEIIQPLLGMISNRDCPEEVVFQAYRALGNICFENDQARKIVDISGLELLVSSIEHYINQNNVQNDKLVTVGCGCLLNVLMSNEELQKASINMHVFKLAVTILTKYIAEFEKHEDCFTHIFVILNALSENLSEEWFPEDLCSVIVNTLRISNNPEVSTLCLDLLRVQADNENMKFHLAQKGTCELIYELVERYMDKATDEDSRSVMKTACDLIVLIITGDKSMELLYDNSTGLVYNQMVHWLQSKDVDLLTTSILALGNFARKESNCLQMMENGVAQQLLDLLEAHSSSEEGNMLLQHALLSALRNLSIPKQNKMKLVEIRLLDIIYTLLKADQTPVVFKLLGTFRMIIDGQEKIALDLMQRKDLIERIVYWYQNSDHTGIKGETARLLAALIKQARTTTFPVMFAVPGTMNCIAEMVSSLHAVMQNEALVALNIVAANCISSDESGSGCKNDNSCADIENIAQQSCSGSCKEPLPELLVKAEIGRHLAFIASKYSESIQKETVENMLTLIDMMKRKRMMVEHLRGAKLHEELLCLLGNAEINSTLGERIKVISNLIRGA